MRHLHKLAMVLAVAAATSLAAGSEVQAAEPEIITYTVQPGDSIWSIAEAFYGSGKQYRIVYKYNTFIGKPPYLLKPGQELRLPVGDVRPEAQVTWTQREVKAKPPKATDWLDARAKMNLWKLYKVSTGDEASVNIVFEDESDLRLRQNALLVIYGGSAQRTKTEKTKVVLEQGTIRGGLAKLDGEPAPIEVEPPSGNVELFAKLAQVQADVGASMVSVYDGRASVKGKVGQPVEVKQGFGTVVKKGKAPEPPRPLPATPAWETAVGDDGVVLAVVPVGASLDYKASWKPVDGASAYRVELANDEAFHEVFIDATIDAAAQQAFLMKDMTEGNYFARVSARDASGLEGPPTAPIELRVVGVESSRAMTREESGAYSCVGLTRLALPQELAESFEWRLGDDLFSSNALRLRRPGSYTVELRRVGIESAATFQVEVLKATATLGDPSEPILRRSPAREVLVAVKDERGRPAVLPEMVIQASPGGVLKAAERGPGEFMITVPAPEKARRVGVRVSWAGGVIGERVYDVANANEDTVPYQFEWREAVLGLETENRMIATGMPAVLPEGFVGFHSRAGTGEGKAPATLSVTLVAETALLEETLGLDAGLTFFQSSLDGETAQSGLGDLVLGGRYLALHGEVIALAPSLRLRLPLSEREGSRVMGFEPGVMARFALTEGFWIDTRQAVVIASDFGDVGTHLAYDGTFIVGVRPMELLGIGAQFDASVSLSTPEEVESWTALAVGLSVYLHLGRVRLGFGAGLGLGEEGKAHYGELSGMLTVDFGYGTPGAEAVE